MPGEVGTLPAPERFVFCSDNSAWCSFLMACSRPLKVYRKDGGGVAFDSKSGFVDRPLELPCGKCPSCRERAAQAWAIRCVHESFLHERNSFVTLTYSPQQLPSDSSLNVRHFQLFAKRLRRLKGRFRYFHAGEYGSVTQRPHYHILLFGLDFSDDAVFYKGVGSERLFTSKTLDSCWTDAETGESRGFAVFGALTYGSCLYVARYCLKKALGDAAPPGRRPEYVTMSRNKGIGHGWISRWHADVFPSDEVVHDGRRFRVPRFYDDFLKREDPEQHAAVLAERRARASTRYAGDSSDAKAQREAAEESTLLAKQKLFNPRGL